MSYEGHYQLLCTRGHLGPEISVGYYGDGDRLKAWRCSGMVENKVCEEPIGWSNTVDDTNCESWGHHDMVEITPAETRVCDLGHTHDWNSATYKPSERPFFYDQTHGWMEIFSIKCPDCGDVAAKFINKDDPTIERIDCCECHNRRVLENRELNKSESNG